MNLKKRVAAGLIAGLTIGGTTVHAQYAQPQWGTGVWGGTQPCPYNVQAGNGAESYLDGYREVQRNLAAEQNNLDDLEAKQRELKDLLEDAENTINGTINSKYADFIIEHASNQRRCSEYQRTARPQPPAPQPVVETAQPPAATAPAPTLPALPPPTIDMSRRPGETKPEWKARIKKAQEKARANQKRDTQVIDDNTSIVEPSRGIASVDAQVSDEAQTEMKPSRGPAGVDGEEGANDELIPITGFTEQQWFSVCVPRAQGAVNSKICTQAPYNSVRKRTASDSECRKALLALTNGYEDIQKVEAQIASAKRKIERLEEEVKATAKSAVRRSRNPYSTQTEAKFCAVCEEYARQARERAQIAGLATAGVGLLQVLSEKQDARQARDERRYYAELNSLNGISTTGQPIITSNSGAGAFLVAGGLANALTGGTGSGAIGCATGLNGTGNANGPMGIAGPYGQGPGLYPVYGQNTGAFGYPSSIIGPQQGGQMYMPGQGSWGPNGPYALNGNQGPILMAPGMPYGNNGSVPFGTVIGVDAYGNRIFSQGGVPGFNGAVQNGYFPAPGTPGALMQNGYYNPYGYNNGQGYTTGPYPYQTGNQFGVNGQGINIGSLPTGGATAYSQQLLQVEAANLQNRAWALGNAGSQVGFNTGNYNGAGYVMPGLMPTNGYLSGSLTIGGTYSTGQPTYNYSTPTTVGSPIIPTGTR